MGIGSVRHLPNGSVMVNDPTKRQLVLFDSTLAKFRIIADTTTNTPNSYGLRSSNGGLVPYMADSTLFLDSESAAFLVFDQTGTFARMMAPTRASDMSWVASGYYGMAGFDPKGRMVYRTYRRSSNTQMAFDASIGPKITYQPDSAPLLRMDFDRRTVDTIGLLKIPVQKSYTVTTMNSITSYSVQNPLPMSDEWTLLPDGTVAIVRGQDYHIDWLSMDGKMTSSPKMPFDWKRITLEEKQQMIDSIKKADATPRYAL